MRPSTTSVSQSVTSTPFILMSGPTIELRFLALVGLFHRGLAARRCVRGAGVAGGRRGRQRRRRSGRTSRAAEEAVFLQHGGLRLVGLRETRNASIRARQAPPAKTRAWRVAPCAQTSPATANSRRIPAGKSPIRAPSGRRVLVSDAHAVHPDAVHAERRRDEARMPAGQVEARAASAPRPTVAGSKSSKVGGVAGLERAAAAGCRRRCAGIARQPAHRFLQRQRAALAHPVAEQVQAEAGVVEEREVRAGVGQRHQARRVAQHLRPPRPRRS